MPSTQVQAGPLGARVCDFFSRTARLTFRGGRRNLETGFPERERGGRGIPGQLTAQAQAVTNWRDQRGEHASGQVESARASTDTQVVRRRQLIAQAQAARERRTDLEH